MARKTKKSIDQEADELVDCEEGTRLVKGYRAQKFAERIEQYGGDYPPHVLKPGSQDEE